MSFCFPYALFHAWGPWRIVAEVPVWKKAEFGNTYYAAGNQPPKEQLYSTNGGGTVKRIEPDYDFLLIGKFMEQKRVCVHCELHQLKWSRFTV